MAAQKRTTMGDVARAAGVSVMTVSLALRKSPRIPVATRERVLAEAEKLGYRPDPALSALVAHRANVRLRKDIGGLAFVTNWKEKDDWRATYAGEFFEGARARAAQSGYALDPFWLREYKHHEAASRVLRNRGVQGLLIAPLPKGFSHLNLDWQHFSAVSVGLSLARPRLHRVTHDYQNSGAVTIHHVRRLGYARVALVLPKRVNKLSDYRIPGVFWEEWRRSRRGQQPIFWIEAEADKRPFLRWFRRTRPEVIVALQQHYLLWLIEDGWQVPEEVGFANLHVLPGTPETSGILYGGREIGAAGADLLNALLLNNEMGIPIWQRQVTISGHWNSGKTLRRAG